jgi:hypothetical protein
MLHAAPSEKYEVLRIVLRAFTVKDHVKLSLKRTCQFYAGHNCTGKCGALLSIS